jgi:oxalate decarboxylase/phosphoglucose isomerase-like protein (cupin superfamily)
MQEAGDALYVPQHWGHAVYNTAPSVGVAYEFDV